MDKKAALVVFDDKNIRRTWFNDEWWYSVVDVVGIFGRTIRPSDYAKVLE